MDIYEETKAPLQKLWVDGNHRQQSKLVILQAIANVSDLSARSADDILDELDRLLLSEESEPKNQVNRGL